MVSDMTHWERVKAALTGGDIDRPPISMWKELQPDATSHRTLVEATLAFQSEYDWDFVNINPRDGYQCGNWAKDIGRKNSAFRSSELFDWVVKSPDDWSKIEILDPTTGTMGEHLDALDQIVKQTSAEVPVLMVMSTPLAVAAQLAGSSDSMLRLIECDVKALKPALDVITEVLSRFAIEALNRGAAGLFVTTGEWASYDRLSDNEYAALGRPYDVRLFKSVADDSEFSVLHVCESENMLVELKDYPVHAYSWEAQDDTNVWLLEAAKLTRKAVIGGLSLETLTMGLPEAVAEEVRWNNEMIEGSGWMIAPGCEIPSNTPPENLRSAKAAVDALGI